MKRTLLIVIALMLVLAALLGGCGNKNGQPTPTPATGTP
jgi:predicted small lipoprotein YifL